MARQRRGELLLRSGTGWRAGGRRELSTRSRFGAEWSGNFEGFNELLVDFYWLMRVSCLEVDLGDLASCCVGFYCFSAHYWGNDQVSCVSVSLSYFWMLGPRPGLGTPGFDHLCGFLDVCSLSL